jgi:hypothetical protein
MGLAIHDDGQALGQWNGGLARKILKVMSLVGPVHKDKRNDFHGYGYASDEAIVTALRNALIEAGLCITPSQKSCVEVIQKNAKGEETTLTKLEVQFILTDASTGETSAATFFGYGSDKMDKGVYKAMTGAEKYFLMKTFLIATPDDPENEGARRAFSANRQPPPPRRPYEPTARPPAPPAPPKSPPAAVKPPAPKAPPPPPPTTDLAGDPLPKDHAPEPVWDEVEREAAAKTHEAMHGERQITDDEFNAMTQTAKDRKITPSQMVLHARNNLGITGKPAPLKTLTKRQYDRMMAWIEGRTK